MDLGSVDNQTFCFVDSQWLFDVLTLILTLQFDCKYMTKSHMRSSSSDLIIIPVILGHMLFVYVHYVFFKISIHGLARYFIQHLNYSICEHQTTD